MRQLWAVLPLVVGSLIVGPVFGQVPDPSAEVAAPEQAWMFGPFERPDGANPILTPDSTSTFYCPMRERPVRWEAMATFNPAAVVRGDSIFVLYRAEDMTGEMIIGGHTSRIGMAASGDGVHFERRSRPVLYPEPDQQTENEWPGGCEDPRIVEAEDGTYVLTYTQWNRERPQLAVATSRDLLNWEKHGPIFPDLEQESKSGAILTRVEGHRLVATKADGKYWMYWGVPQIYAATSEDLIHWTPLRDDDGELLPVLSPREGHFDAWLVEAGPPAILTDEGILVLYNAGNSAERGDPELADSTYSGGQALYDLEDPTRLLARSDEPFIQPEEAYERTGQYVSGTTFLEGLVPFEGRWYLYYGTADSRVGVAVWTPGTDAPGW